MELKHRQRIFLSTYFFLSGVCFSTWASRIPTIKTSFGYNEAELGTLLLAMPISSLISLPFSGWLVSRFDSRIPILFGFILLAISTALIGFAPTTLLLAGAVSLFSFSLRIINISMNTQAVTLQRQFERKINGSFHALWSTGGIVGVIFSTLLIRWDVAMNMHLLIVAVFSLIATLVCYRHLLRGDRAPSGNKLVLHKPDPYIVYLGLLVFMAAICEGGMIDWNGVYFREVVGEELFTMGYLAFMVLMATSRFVSDRIIESIGMSRTFILSAILVVAGVSLSIMFPYFWPCMIGFCLVGFGTAAIFPMTFLLAGDSKKYSAGMAISIIATYAIAGMLIGPPLIGYLAQAFGLRVAFIAFAITGFMFIPISQLFFRHQHSLSTQKENPA
ncbi:MAG TPA: MFS transporter [Ohtaekwangia sp.]